MVEIETRALKAKEKTEVKGPSEQIKPGPVFTPAVDIYETESGLILLADMPGVKSKDLEIDLHDNLLTLRGEVESPERANEMDVFREFRTGQFYRQFTLSQVIDQARISADLKDGVLRLTLPKVEAAKPRKIQVSTS